MLSLLKIMPYMLTAIQSIIKQNKYLLPHINTVQTKPGSSLFYQNIREEVKMFYRSYL